MALSRLFLEYVIDFAKSFFTLFWMFYCSYLTLSWLFHKSFMALFWFFKMNLSCLFSNEHQLVEHSNFRPKLYKSCKHLDFCFFIWNGLLVTFWPQLCNLNSMCILCTHAPKYFRRVDISYQNEQPIFDSSNGQNLILRPRFDHNYTSITIKKWTQILIVNPTKAIYGHELSKTGSKYSEP